MTGDPPATATSATARVLYVNHVTQLSGAERSLLTLLQQLHRERFAPLAGIPDEVGPLAVELAKLGVPAFTAPLVRLHRTSNPITNMRQVLALRRSRQQIGRICRAEDVALVHANSFHAALACCMKGGPLPPVIWHVRDVQMPAPIVRWVAHRASRLIAISGAVAKHLVTTAPECAGKVVLVHNGIDEASLRAGKSREQVRQMLGVAADAALVVCVGQLVPWKRQDSLIAAAQIVARYLPTTHFAIVGSDMFGEHGDYEARLRQQAAEGEACVRFYGYLPDATDIIAAADILAHPATAEPLGRVILEAMALGTPVVAANAGGPAELLVDAESGLLVEPGDAQAMAEGIMWVLENPGYGVELAEQARERVATNFSAASMTRKIEAVYGDILGRDGGGTSE